MKLLKFLSIIILAFNSAQAFADVMCKRPKGAVFIRPAACNRNEVAVNPVALGLVGPQGAAGPQGVAGAQGAAGARGATGPSGVVSVNSIQVTDTFSQIVSQTQPTEYTFIRSGTTGIQRIIGVEAGESLTATVSANISYAGSGGGVAFINPSICYQRVQFSFPNIWTPVGDITPLGGVTPSALARPSVLPSNNGFAKPVYTASASASGLTGNFDVGFCVQFSKLIPDNDSITVFNPNGWVIRANSSN